MDRDLGTLLQSLRMLGGIFNKLLDSRIRKQVARGLWRCPDCGSRAAKAPKIGASAARCGNCGTIAPLQEWGHASEAGRFVGRPDEPPLGTAMVRGEEGSGAVTWHLPARGGVVSLGPGIIACGVTFSAGGYLLYRLWHARAPVPDAVWWGLILMLGLIWLASIGTLRAGLRKKFGRRILRVDQERVRFQEVWPGGSKVTTFAVTGIEALGLKTTRMKNGSTIYEVEIRGREGKLRFGKELAVEELTWLIADLRRTLYGEVFTPPLIPAPRPPVRRGMGQAAFSLPMSVATKGLISTGVTFLIIAAVFLGFGWFLMRDSPFSSVSGQGPLFFRIFEGLFMVLFWLFRAIWFTVSLGLGGIGVWSISRYFRSRNREIRLDGNEIEVAILTLRHGRVVNEQSFPRESVTDLRSPVSGSIGQMTRCRVMLIAGEQAVVIANWVDAGEAEAFMDQARVALGLENGNL